jgi:hypothetical protein
MTDIQLLRDAAWGCPDSQVKLAKLALAAETLGHADRVVSTVEGLTFARLAASRGDVAALGLVITLQSQLAELLDDAGLMDKGDNARSEALGAADAAVDLAPDASLGEILAAHLTAVDLADPDTPPAAREARNKWFPGE